MLSFMVACLLAGNCDVTESFGMKSPPRRDVAAIGLAAFGDESSVLPVATLPPAVPSPTLATLPPVAPAVSVATPPCVLPAPRVSSFPTTIETIETPIPPPTAKRWVWLTKQRCYGYGYQREDGFWVIDAGTKRATSAVAPSLPAAACLTKT